MSLDESPLREVFPPQQFSDWKEQATADLPGRRLERLASHTADRIEIRPLYTVDDEPREDAAGMPGIAPFVRGAHLTAQPVHVRAMCPRADTILDELERGADEVFVQLEAEDIDRALAGVDSDRVFLDGSSDLAARARAWSNWVGTRTTTGGPGLDPVAAAATTGDFAGLDFAFDTATEAVSTLIERHPDAALLRVDTSFAHHAGASEAEDLATAMAIGVEMLRRLEHLGVSPARGARVLEFTTRTGTRFFESIARLRATRGLWSDVLAACEVHDVAPRVFALPSERMLTRRDPWVNLLRATAADFAAITGGAHAVAATCFDMRLGESDELGRRLARNTPIILREESHLGRVVDPAGGSWFLEELTEKISDQAWALFQEIESAGGIVAVLSDGSWLERIDATWARSERDIRSRRVAITGVSEFAKLDEQLPPRPARSIANAAWPVRHASDRFEALRDASDLHLARTGRRPAIFLASLGPLAAHSARTGWVRNLLAAGGIEALGGQNHADAESAARAAGESGAHTAVICSSDALYETNASALALALKASGIRHVLLAGKPGGHEADWRHAGVDEFLHLGIDVVTLLEQLLAFAEVER